jgi:hypothetical protein
VVVAALLGWDGFELPSDCEAWRLAARQLLEFLVHTTVRARVNWLAQLDEYLSGFGQHPVLVGKRENIVGIEEVVQHVLCRLAEEIPCEHWKLSPTLPGAPELGAAIGRKTEALDTLIGEVEQLVRQAHLAGIKAAASLLQSCLEELRRLRRQSLFINNCERAFLACQRVHSLKTWKPDSVTPATGPPEKGKGQPPESERVADLWVFVVRAVSGVASWIEFVMSAAGTVNTEVTNRNKVFGYWELRAQAFAGSLLFHALNARSRVLQWESVVHWRCGPPGCRDWKAQICRKPPSGDACRFSPQPVSMAILRHKYVRSDQIGQDDKPYTLVPVWLCHGEHGAKFPSSDSSADVEKDVQVVYAKSKPKCPWCDHPHGQRPAEVVVVAEHLRNIT